jgi:putative mRNA 3-end processing factor
MPQAFVKKITQLYYIMALIVFSEKGLYCPQGGFYIDPWVGVDKAVITHAHSDHARWGSQYYLCHHFTKPLLQLRLGNNNYESIGWNEPVFLNGVQLSLHPAGHIIGSSQVRIEYKGEVWVFSGDYKTENDNLSEAFEPLKCNYFITECTFGLPIYNWQKQEQLYAEIGDWIVENITQNSCSVLFAYSLGKAQRVIQAASTVTNNIFVHGAIWNMHEVLLQQGFCLPKVKKITTSTSKNELKNAVIIAPPSTENSSWLKKFNNYKTAICSGWMQVRGNKRRNNADIGFAISDHADWNGLLNSVKNTEAEMVYTTHGSTAVFSRYLNEIGIKSMEVKTQYGHEETMQ